jgi:hypothetical protein
MMLADDDFYHPYSYARIIGIFHVMVKLDSARSTNRTYHRMEFLWGRWYDFDSEVLSGFKAKRLHQVHFLPYDNDDAFGFIDPSTVIRGVHLIPSFVSGQTRELLGRSMARRVDEGDSDYNRYYVNM